MATYNIIDIGRQYLFGAAAFLRTHPSSWLVYDPPASAQEPQDSLSALTVMTPAVNHSGLDPKATHQPVAIEIVKANKPNLFPLGITVGRTENNDIVLKDEQISRFHAYFQEQGGKLYAADANSKNGTFLDGRKLEPLKPALLAAEAVLRFGLVEVRYLQPERFFAYLEQLGFAARK